MDEQKNKYHTFPQKKVFLKELLPLIRSSCSSNYDESGTNIVICPECEEWTHVEFDANSCLLDLLGNLIVTDIDARDGDIIVWIETDEFNWFSVIYGK